MTKMNSSLSPKSAWEFSSFSNGSGGSVRTLGVVFDPSVFIHLINTDVSGLESDHIS